MTPKLAQAVDPILLCALDLLDRVSSGGSTTAEDEQLRIRALFDQADAVLGNDVQWQLGKYALASWIDEMLVDAPWDGKDWWSNNVLEVQFFNTRLCFEQFFLQAQQAANLPQRDALEVFYICVILGFRGFYHDAGMAERSPNHTTCLAN